VSAPLIVSLLLDPASQQRFDDLRTAHFPARPGSGAGGGLFRLDAHVTLFHALPGERVAEVRGELAAAAARPPFDVRVGGVRFLGRGVAFDLTAPEVTALRADVAAAFDTDLTAQDRQWRHPHVTVQNKVEPAVARALHAQLAAEFTPWTATARGLGLWHYRGGPWELDSEFAFG